MKIDVNKVLIGPSQILINNLAFSPILALQSRLFSFILGTLLASVLFLVSQILKQ